MAYNRHTVHVVVFIAMIFQPINFARKAKHYVPFKGTLLGSESQNTKNEFLT
jgi:hypothetical protein